MMNILWIQRLTTLLGVVLLLVSESPVAAQSTGLIFDDAGYDAAPSLPTFGNGSKFNETKLKVDLSRYAPYPGNQGENGSCVGWAVGYAAMSIAYAELNEITDRRRITDMAFSSMYIYNQIKVGDCPAGARINDAMDLLRSDGNVRHQEFQPSSCHTAPGASLRSMAQENRIAEYMTLFNYAAPAEEKIENTRRHLNASNNPVVIGMTVRSNLMNLGSGDAYWNPNIGDTRSLGGHAMCVVGYDEGKRAFKIMNSWGEDWGQDGFFWIKYEDYGKLCKYGYAMVLTGGSDEPVPGEEVSLAGSFKFRYLDDNGSEAVNVGGDTYYFSPAPVSEYNSTYTTTQASWPRGQMFQLVAIPERANQYVYVFSIDPNGEANIHWPKRETLGYSDFDGMKNVPLIQYSGAELVIPSENNALQISEPGVDHLIVLYSNNLIDDDDFTSIVRSVRNDTGPMYRRLEGALGSRLIPASDITYDPRRMKLEARSRYGTVAPIILEVTGR